MQIPYFPFMRRPALLAALLPAMALGQGYNPAFLFNEKSELPFMLPAREGLFAFEKEKKFGYVDKNLKVVVPAEFEWRKGQEFKINETPTFKDGYALVRKEEKWGIIDRTGKKVSPFFECNAFVDFDIRSNRFVLSRTPILSPMLGLVDGTGKEILPFEYKRMRIDSTVVVAAKKELLDVFESFYLFDLSGKKLTDNVKYMDLIPYPREGVVIAKLIDGHVLLDLKGNMLTVGTNTQAFASVSQGRIIFQDRNNQLRGLLDLKGNVVLNATYKYMATSFDERGTCRVGQPKAGNPQQYDYGYIDRNGKEVMPIDPSNPEFAGNPDFGIAQDPVTRKKGIKDRSGRWVIPAEYADAKYPDRFGGVWLRLPSDNSWHYVSFTGKDYGSLTPRGTMPYEFDEQGFALAAMKDSSFRVAFDNGRIMDRIPDCMEAGPFKEGLAPIKARSTGKFGFIDSTGKAVIPCTFDFVEAFNDGIARVFRSVNGKLMGGYMDKKGKIVLPMEYEAIGVFRDGLGLVRKPEGYFYVDRTGKLKPPHKPFFQVTEFEYGLALGVQPSGMQGQPATFTYFDNQFKDVLTLQAYDARSFSGNVAFVNRSGTGYSIINRKGETVNPLPIVNDIKFYGEGLFAVKQIRRWGFMDEKGTIVIPTVYDSVGQFMGGFAPALRFGSWGVIDKTGKWVVENKYGNVRLGDEGQVSYQENSMSDWGMKWFFGGESIPALLSYTTPFREGKAIVRYTWKYTIIRSPLAK